MEFFCDRDRNHVEMHLLKRYKKIDIDTLDAQTVLELVTTILFRCIFVGAEKISVSGRGVGDGVWSLHFLECRSNGEIRFLCIDQPKILVDKLAATSVLKVPFEKLVGFVTTNNQSCHLEVVRNSQDNIALIRRPVASLLNSGVCNGINIVTSALNDQAFFKTWGSAFNLFPYLVLELRVSLVCSDLESVSVTTHSLAEFFFEALRGLYLPVNTFFYKQFVFPRLQEFFDLPDRSIGFVQHKRAIITNYDHHSEAFVERINSGGGNFIFFNKKKKSNYL